MKIFDDRPNIKAMFRELNKEHFGGEIPDIPVVWNGRMTTTAGYCRYTRQFTGNLFPTKIDLSEKLFVVSDGMRKRLGEPSFTRWFTLTSFTSTMKRVILHAFSE